MSQAELPRPFISTIKFWKRPILPPVLNENHREEMRELKKQALLVETRVLLRKYENLKNDPSEDAHKERLKIVLYEQKKYLEMHQRDKNQNISPFNEINEPLQSISPNNTSKPLIIFDEDIDLVSHSSTNLETDNGCDKIITESLSLETNPDNTQHSVLRQGDCLVEDVSTISDDSQPLLGPNKVSDEVEDNDANLELSQLSIALAEDFADTINKINESIDFQVPLENSYQQLEEVQKELDNLTLFKSNESDDKPLALTDDLNELLQSLRVSSEVSEIPAEGEQSPLCNSQSEVLTDRSAAQSADIPPPSDDESRTTPRIRRNSYVLENPSPALVRAVEQQQQADCQVPFAQEQIAYLETQLLEIDTFLGTLLADSQSKLTVEDLSSDNLSWLDPKLHLIAHHKLQMRNLLQQQSEQWKDMVALHLTTSQDPHLDSLPVTCSSPVTTPAPESLHTTPEKNASLERPSSKTSNPENLPIKSSTRRRAAIHTPAELAMLTSKLTRLPALVKGYLTRRLFKTKHIENIIQVIQDTLRCALDFHNETPIKEGVVTPKDANLHQQLIDQLNMACYELNDIFHTWSPNQRMDLIAQDRASKKQANRPPQPWISQATIKYRERKKNNKNPPKSVPVKPRERKCLLKSTPQKLQPRKIFCKSEPKIRRHSREQTGTSKCPKANDPVKVTPPKRGISQCSPKSRGWPTRISSPRQIQASKRQSQVKAKMREQTFVLSPYSAAISHHNRPSNF